MLTKTKPTRRIAWAAAVTLLVAAIFAGCAAGGPAAGTTAAGTAAGTTAAATEASTTSAAAETATSAQPAEASEAAYTVDFAVMQPQADMSDQDQVEAFLNGYLEKSLPNTKIHFTFIPSDQYGNKLMLDATAGVPHDLLCGTGLNFSSSVAQGLFSPLPMAMLNQYAPDVVRRVDPRYWAAVTVKGEIYAIPNPFVYSQPTGWAFNKAMCDQYNFDATKVKSYKDMEPFLAAVKAGSPGIVPLFPGLGTYTGSYLDYVAGDNTIAYDTKRGVLEWCLDDPTYQENAAVLADFYNKGYLPDNLASLANTSANELFSTGKYAVATHAGVYDPSSEKSTNAYGYQTQEVLTDTFVIGTGRIHAVFVALSATSKNPERSIMFENLLYKDKEFANYVGYGKEGLNWNYVSGKGTDSPTVQTVDGSKWVIWICWISPLWDQWPSNWNSAKALEEMKQWTDSADVSPLLGFVADTEPVKSQLAQLAAILSEASGTLTQGAEGDAAAYLAETKKKAEAAGLQQVLDELNRQIDDWKAANGK